MRTSIVFCFFVIPLSVCVPMKKRRITAVRMTTVSSPLIISSCIEKTPLYDCLTVYLFGFKNAPSKLRPCVLRGRSAYRKISQSGSTFLQAARTFSMTVLGSWPSANSTIIFWVMKLTVALCTPAVLRAASSIRFAQLAQSTSIL